jgi:aspartate oxidase
MFVPVAERNLTLARAGIALALGRNDAAVAARIIDTRWAGAGVSDS